MRILIINQTLRGGGFKNWLLRLAGLLLSRGDEVHYVSTKRFPLNGVKSHVVKEPSMALPLFLKFAPKARKKAQELHREKPFDLVIAPALLFAYIARPLKRMGVPIISFMHGDIIKEQEITRGPIAVKTARYLVRKSLEVSDRVITVSSRQREGLIEEYGLSPRRVEYVHNTIDRKRFSPKRSRLPELPKGWTVGFVGTLDRIKNLGMLIRAFARLPGNDARLVLAGEGDQEGMLRGLARELGIQDRVLFLGFREDVPELLNSFDLVVLSSLNEGCPTIVLESLACRTPVIGTRVGGTPELLKYDELLFPSGDTDALSERMARLKTDREFLRHVKDLCDQRRKALDFDWESRTLEAMGLRRKA